MHRWLVFLWVSGSGSLACGPSDTTSTGGSESTAADTTQTAVTDNEPTGAGTTESGPMLDYEACLKPLTPSPDEIESPDTEHFVKLLEQAFVDGGYGEAAKVEHAQMIDNTGLRFCPQISVRSHWFAANEYSCFEHGNDDEMRALFDAYVAEWQALPATMIPLTQVESTVNGCFAGIYHPYEPCNFSPWEGTFTLQFRNNRWINDCDLEIDVATIDLVTGELLTCETVTGGGGCEEAG